MWNYRAPQGFLKKGVSTCALALGMLLLSATAEAGPRIMLSAPSSPRASSGPSTYTVTYDKAQSITLAANHITLAKTGNVAATISVTGTGLTKRTITLNPISGDGKITSLAIAAGAGTDIFGIPIP